MINEIMKFIESILPYTAYFVFWFMFFNICIFMILIFKFHLSDNFYKFLRFYGCCLYVVLFVILSILDYTILFGMSGGDFSDLNFVLEKIFLYVPAFSVYFGLLAHLDPASKLLLWFLFFIIKFVNIAMICFPLILFFVWGGARYDEKVFLLKAILVSQLIMFFFIFLWTLKNIILVHFHAAIWCLRVTPFFYLKYIFFKLLCIFKNKKYSGVKDVFFYKNQPDLYTEFIFIFEKITMLYVVILLFILLQLFFLCVLIFYILWNFESIRNHYIYGEYFDSVKFLMCINLIVFCMLVSLVLFNVLLCFILGPSAFPQFIVEILYKIFL